MEVFFEVKVHGSVMRVAAIDSQSGTEAVVTGPANAGDTHLRQLALRKLEYLLKKKSD